MRLREQMPELDGATQWYNSKPIKKSDLMGNKPVLIHFWSISCELCKDVMPKVNGLREGYRGRIHMIAVHMPRSKKDINPEAVRKSADEHDVTHPIFVDDKQILTKAFRNQYVPAYYLFDEKGKLRHYQSGGGGMHMLRSRITRLLGEN